MTETDMRRELAKTRDALVAARDYLASYSEAMAALHCAATVQYSPLHARVTAALGDVERALERPASPNDGLAMVLLDLDRCEHGRHQGDVCGDCGGDSVGNKLLPPGTRIGTGLYALPIVMPDRDHKHDPSQWRQDTP